MTLSTLTQSRLFAVPLRASPAILCVLAFVVAMMVGVGASVRIPLPWTPVPITLQTFVVFLGAALLGRHYALQMVGWYVGLGILGMPLFSGGTSGWDVLVGARGGYLIGFFVAATWIGYAQTRVTNFWNQIALFLSASVLLFACGAAWLGWSLHLNLQQTLMAGVWPFIPGDCAKILAAASILHGRKYFSKS